MQQWLVFYRRCRFLPITVVAVMMALLVRIQSAEQNAQKGLFITTSFAVAEEKQADSKDEHKDKEAEKKPDEKHAEEKDKKSDEKSKDDKKEGEKKSDEKSEDKAGDKKSDEKKAEKPKETDPLDTQTQVMRSSSELAVLKSLAERRSQIEKREAELNDREALLKASEKQFDEKLSQLTALRNEIKNLLEAAKAKEDEETQKLVAVYEKMKPKESAGIFNNMSMDILLPIARGMKEAKLSPILAVMQPDKARLVTAQLFAKSKIIPQDSPIAAAANQAAAPPTAPVLPEKPPEKPVEKGVEKAAPEQSSLTPAAPAAAAPPAHTN